MIGFGKLYIDILRELCQNSLFKTFHLTSFILVTYIVGTKFSISLGRGR